jgi:hypothetical protein
MAKTIGILLFDDVEELDAVGPWEVLAAWCTFWPDDGWRVTTFSVDGATVTGAKGLRIEPHASAADVGPLAIVLHPGGQGTRPLLKDPEHLDRVRGWAEAAEITTSVCTGSLVGGQVIARGWRPETVTWCLAPSDLAHPGDHPRPSVRWCLAPRDPARPLAPRIRAEPRWQCRTVPGTS